MSGDFQKRKRFEREALPHLDALFTTAMHLSRNRDDADDLCQETMLRAYRFFHQFTPGTDCRAWLFTILYNVFRSGYARNRRREEVAASAEEFEQALRNESHKAAAHHSPEEALFGDSLSREVQKALHRIPEDLRITLMLVDVNELSYEQAAKTMGVPIGTVRSRLSRARTLLRYALQRSVWMRRSTGS